MTNTPTIMVMKSGKTIGSTDIRDYKFHSGHTMYKIHDIKTGIINLYTGDQTGYVDITHGLNYVPKFLVYINGQLFPTTCRSYATDSIIRVKIDLGAPYNRVTTTYTANQAAFEDSTTNYNIIAGQKLNSGTGSAVRFTDIIIDQGRTITSANFEWQSVETSSGQDIKFKIWGIDQDNCGSFSDYGDAGSRPRTDAFNTKTQSPNTSEFNFGDSFTNLMQEIVNRSGWVSGNDMGFVFNDNDTPDNHFMGVSKSYGVDKIKLTVTLDGTATSPFVNNVRVVVFKDKITD